MLIESILKIDHELHDRLKMQLKLINYLDSNSIILHSIFHSVHKFLNVKKCGTLHDFACHPCGGAMLIFSVSYFVLYLFVRQLVPMLLLLMCHQSFLFLIIGTTGLPFAIKRIFAMFDYCHLLMMEVS